ncbi:MAG: class I SAM-dependent methyltransferase, partial [Gemmatimonadota bacterium]|nr:class I SAM-dependent methyltransferase [Gemmatimonadota bacterium]
MPGEPQTMTLPRIRLAPGRDAPLRGRHPWAFAGALAGSNSETEDGAEVEVVAADGTFVARGLYNGRSQVRVRLYAWDPVPLDEEFFRARIAAALDLRNRTLGLGDPEGACRVVFSEGDGLSGLTVDRYGDYLAVQFTSLALARRQEMILDVLEEALRPRGIVLRTEKGIREEEGLELRDGVVRGDVPEEPFPIVDEGLSFLVDLRTGQKTGYYLDQRVNRVRTASYASGRTVADVCTYTGGFALRAAAGGALSVVGVDRSEPALELARANARRNGVD